MKGEDIKVIKELLRIIKQSGLGKVEIETAGITVRTTQEAPPPMILPPTALPPPSAAAPVTEPKADKPQSNPNLVTIFSPMIGTFYRASSPEVPPYIEVGKKVKVGQTVCMIEAMKLFNEVEAEIAGSVVEILVENASPVEYNQPLFVVDTST